MNNNLFFRAIIVCGLLISCGENAVKNTSKKYFDIENYFKSEIKELTQKNPGLDKTIAREENPESIMTDTVNWQNELSVFFEIDINKPAFENKYEITIDSNKSLQITTYYTRDTNLAVQRIAVTRLNGKIQLLEAETKKRSFMVDRDVKYSYMPGKGYGIVVRENYIWSKPESYEIYAQIKDPATLYR